MARARTRCRLWTTATAVALLVCCGCSLLYITPLYRASVLTAVPAPQHDGYSLADDGSAVYDNGDVQVVVRPLTDPELNGMFPQESSLGEYSINPYTFGDWVDPDVGYVRNRFTVFRVTVHNRSLAKVELDPLRAVLTTDRPGEVLRSYGIQAGAAERTFEAYYRARRRPSGNEYYRFNMRMGIVRSNNYGVDEKIFTGESYGGLIVFDPLDDDVESVQLVLRDFVLKFSAFDAPLETVDLRFDLGRSIITGDLARAADGGTRAPTVTRLRSPSDVSGNATGDVSRDPGTLDGIIGEHLSQINDCFAMEYLAGTAAEGQLDLRFSIDADGRVQDVAVPRSTVVSDAVPQCAQERVASWDFGSTQMPLELLVGDAQAGPTAYLVTVAAFLEFIDVRGGP